MSQIILQRIVFEQKLNNHLRRRQIIWYFKYLLYFLLIIGIFHYLKLIFVDRIECKDSDPNRYDLSFLNTQINILSNKLREFEKNYEKVDMKIEKSLKLYDTDKIGVYDYAAEYAGATIISTPNTVSYLPYNLTIMGINVFSLSTVQYMIQPQNNPRHCFAFYGKTGRIRIKLAAIIAIKGVSLEHNYLWNKKNAPKDFRVLGLNYEDDPGVVLGDFTFDLNSDRLVQIFKIRQKFKQFGFIELFIKNNYGDHITCIYRFRVLSDLI